MQAFSPGPTVRMVMPVFCSLCSLQILACSAGTGVLATWPAKLGQKSSSAEQENEGAWKFLQHGPGCPAVREKFPISLQDQVEGVDLLAAGANMVCPLTIVTGL